VNASGQVVGYSATAGDAEAHAFSWTEQGGMVDLGTLGGTANNALAVTNSGLVAEPPAHGIGPRRNEPALLLWFVRTAAEAL